MKPTIYSFRMEFAFLSNFYAAPITHAGEVWPTVEHAFQAAKTLDLAERERIRRCATPAAAKALGRAIGLRDDWERVKVQVMLDLLRLKFTQHPGLAAKLLATGDAALVEGNTWGDRVWGMTLDAHGAWHGKNYLGKLLMRVRDELRSEGS